MSINLPPPVPLDETVHSNPKSLADPTKSSRSLAIALIVSAVLVLAAGGVVIWLIMTNGSRSATVNNVSPDDTKEVKKVSFVVPPTLPANYAKNDQSSLAGTTVYYDDDATSCGITAGVITVPTTKSVRDAVVESVTSLQPPGVTIATNAKGATYAIKDADGKKTYTFDSVDLVQDVNVGSIPYAKRNTSIAYKQFGAQVATLSYACKTETWADKKAELVAFIEQFTVKTER